jgi:cell division septation protein DedD
MESSLKQRLIGAAVLVALAVIFLPMLLQGPDVKEPDAAQVPLSMPAAPGQEYETRELPLTAPEGGAPAGGVLGMTPAAPEALPPPDVAAPAPTLAEGASSAAAAPAPVPAPVAVEPAAAPVPAPVPPPAAPAEPAAVASGDYVVNIGSFSNLDNANALVAKLRAQKLPVIVDKVSLASGTGMRVRVGPYADRATAESARLRAEGVTGTAGRVIALDSASAAKPAPAAPTPKPAATAAKPVATAAPKPAPAANPNAGGVGFAVQLSAPSVEAEANALRDKARAQGFSSYVQPVATEGGKRYRVRVGPVADRAAAEALRDEVNGKLGSKGIIVSNP